jgi:ubiquinone/menaquinone biosynthesis C-methylase UbiE
MATLLFPGRHILNTRFQEEYLLSHLRLPIDRLPLLGNARPSGIIDRVVFAVTSANQSHSRFNPVPLDVRAVSLDRFARRLNEGLPTEYRILPIPHFAPTDKFARHLLKEICEGTEDRLDLRPSDTVVLSSTPEVIRQFLALEFSILPGELENASLTGPTALDFGELSRVAGGDSGDLAPRFLSPIPTDVLKQIAVAGDAWADDPLVRAHLSPATLGCWRDFPDVPRRILRLFRDPLLTEQGSLTEMRNYSIYAQGMNERAVLRLKYDDIKAAIVPGKIADEGCADGALLVPIAEDFPDSDLVGIEITGEFLARCKERLRALEYGGTYIHFHQRNINEPIFAPNSIDTTICNSTTHELWSYGNQATTLRAYLREKFRQTRKGGRILIRDVVGPPDREREVCLWCNDADGSNDASVHAFNTSDDLAEQLSKLSTAARFRRFARDFLADLRSTGRRDASTALRFREETNDGKTYFVLRLRDAVEFMTKKDYTTNWRSEMNEEFAFWDLAEWNRELAEAGFTVIENSSDAARSSRAYVNDWIVKNRWEGKVELLERRHDGKLERLAWPVTNMVLIGDKR